MLSYSFVLCLIVMKSFNLRCLYMFGIYILNFWFRDTIREYTSLYKVLIWNIFVSFYVLICSESLFFMVFFLSIIYCTWSSVICHQDGLYFPNGSELTFLNTDLLCVSGICLGNTYLSSVSHILCQSFYLSLYLISFTFIHIQRLEFHNIPLYIGATVSSCLLFILTGLHLFHVLIAICVHGLMLCLLYPIWLLFNFYCLYVCVILIYVVYRLQLMYWHFVESLWLFIYKTLFL
jgi:heme/copper-type cytochrome/quinol oxidase subunit 3